MRTNSPSLVAATVACLLAVAAHGLLLWQFTGESLFLTPDFTDYLIGARSLVTGQGYCDLSDPDRPRLTRPVGVSTLMMPVVGDQGPFPILDCKRIMNAVSLLLCLAGGWFAARAFDGRWGLLVAILLAVSPVTVSVGIDIYSEVPYSLCVLLLMGLLAGVGPTSSDRGVIAAFLAAVVLAFAAEKCRTMGMVLWPGLLLAALTTRRKAACAAIVVVGFVLSTLFDRLPMFGAPIATHYVQFFKATHGGQGTGAMLNSMGAASRSYFECFSAVVCPVLWPGLDWFGLQARYLLPEWLGVGLGVMVVLVVGAKAVDWLRTGRTALAIVATVHFAGVFAALLIWPRMARLAFPLYACLTCVFWAAVVDVVGRLIRADRKRFLGIVPTMAVTASVVSSGIFVRDAALPAGMWPQVKKAGSAFADNRDPNLRIATDLKDLYLVTGRPQRFINTASFAMDELTRALLATHANHYGFVGRLTDAKLRNNPTYIFKPIVAYPYGFSVLALEPNVRGCVAVENQKLAATATMESVASKSAKELLQDVVQKALIERDIGGNLQATIDKLQHVLEGTRLATPGATEAWLVLGLLELEALAPDRARAAFTKASMGDYADVYASTIAGGRESAAAIDPLVGKAGQKTDVATVAAIREQIASSMLASGRYTEALKLAEAALHSDARRLPAQAIRLLAIRRLHGPAATPEALDAATKAISNRSPADRQLFQQPIQDIRFQIVAARTLSALQSAMPLAFELLGAKIDVDPFIPAAWVEFTNKAEREGLPGLALALLSNAVESDDPKFAALRKDPQVWWTLAVLNDSFGRAVQGHDCALKAQSLEQNK